MEGRVCHPATRHFTSTQTQSFIAFQSHEKFLWNSSNWWSNQERDRGAELGPGPEVWPVGTQHTTEGREQRTTVLALSHQRRGCRCLKLVTKNQQKCYLHSLSLLRNAWKILPEKWSMGKGPAHKSCLGSMSRSVSILGWELWPVPPQQIPDPISLQVTRGICWQWAAGPWIEHRLHHKCVLICKSYTDILCVGLSVYPCPGPHKCWRWAYGREVPENLTFLFGELPAT